MLPKLGNLKNFSLTYQSLCGIAYPGGSCIGNYLNYSTSNSSAAEPENIQVQSNYDVTTADVFSHIAHILTPLWKMPYEEQLNVKYEWTIGVKKMIKERLKLHLKAKRKIDTMFSPRVHKVMASPVTEGYRNKDEFSVRNGPDGNPKTVGFFTGSTASKDVLCVPGTHILSLRKKHKDLAHSFEQYIRTSELPTCLTFAPGGGNWRRFVVRSNEEGQVLAVAICHPQSLEHERLVEEQQKLKEYFTSGPGKDNCPDSLYFQACPHTRCTNEQAPYTLLHGEPFIMEQMAGKIFRLSPDSFFQVNTKAAEVLYETILRETAVTPRSTLLDVCCGVGPISLLAAEHSRGCVGIESVQASVLDAKYNAKINNATNVNFFYGLAEKAVGKILEQLDLASDIVPVLNPGRAGLDRRVIQSLIECPQITRVIYVSCKPDMPSTQKNFVQLIAGNFSLKSIIPVDLFPHTWHTEVVLTFIRRS